jgi:GTP-binding protein
MALAELPRVPVPEDDREPLRIAIVGRPNVGKSSLLNRLLGAERSVVSAIPGTTRDAVDSLFERGGKRYLFVDTAGIRRVRHLEENVDHVSVVQARRSLERADVALLLLDAVEGLRDMDATIAGYVQEAGRPVVLVVNKWDRAGEIEMKQRAFEQAVRDRLKFLPWAPVVFASAKSGKGLTAILTAAAAAHKASRLRVATGPLNRALGRAAEAHAPKAAKGGHAVKLLYSAQIGVDPPTFAITINHPVDLHFSYKRYLENQLRKEFGFAGTPIVLKVRARRH